MSLTDTTIKKAKPGDKPVKLSDGKGLYLLVNPVGSKLWRWKYRFLGKEKLMSLGAYPDVSLAQARDGMGAARKLLASGTDPMAQRATDKITKQASAENSFQSVALLWCLTAAIRESRCQWLPGYLTPLLALSGRSSCITGNGLNSGSLCSNTAPCSAAHAAIQASAIDSGYRALYSADLASNVSLFDIHSIGRAKHCW